MPGAAGWLPWLRPCRASDLPELVRLAELDGHAVVGPSHVVVKNGRLAGYASLARVPLLLTWLDGRAIVARDTQYLLNMCENAAGNLAPDVTLCVPCAHNSPLRPYMPRFGYADSGQSWGLHFKKVS